MKNLITIEQNDQKVLTTEQLAGVYGTDINNIQANFKNNKDKFVEGTHFHLLRGNELKTFKSYLNDIQLPINKFAAQLYLWTERGASRHCKILDTDNAWEQFDNLEEAYFNVKGKPQPQFVIPQTMSELLCLAESLFKENQLLLPKAEAFDEFLSAENASTIGTAGQFFGKGQQRFFDFLREQKILKKKGTTPYQKYLDRGYFNIKYTTKYINGKNHIFAVTLVTPKGMLFLSKKFALHPVSYGNDNCQLYLV